ncbi:major capsid protein [Desulfosporosinus sp. FKA]|uniref:major capsid protein n=1 Tax=Desulfosporosinus sp. FKA TaxID=1969834 RepID=UPI000B498AB0|nr:major capsid protein [Desulfosporosinus sp. FKA]
MTNLTFPTTQEINHIVRNIITDPTKYRGMEFCPIVSAYAARIQVDVINATYGITPPHALNAEPKVATLTGQSIREYATGYWRETYRINEEELLYARQEGTYNERAGRLRVMRRATELNTRLDTRVEQLRWAALVNGKVQVNDNGVNYTVDYKIPTSNKVTLPWASNPNQNIAQDISMLQELYFGTGAVLDTIYISHQVAKALAANATLMDMLKQSVYAVNLSASNITKALQILFPEIKFEVYAEGYSSDGKSFTQFLPSNSFVGVGKGGEVGMDFCTTLALQNGGMDNPQPGKFSAIEDKSGNEKNPYVDVTVGINGLPRIHHPNWYISGTAN